MCQPSSTVPTYEEMGKSLKDFFNKGFPLDIFKISGKKAFNSVASSMFTLTQKLEDKTAVCEWENKFAHPPWGLNSTVKVDTANMTSIKVDTADKITPGLRLGVDTQLNMETLAKTGNINGTYKLPQMGTFDLGMEAGDETDMLLNGSAVGMYQNFLGGYQISYDATDGTLKKNNLAGGYLGRGWKLHANMDNAETIEGMFHCQPSCDIELGLHGSYTSGDDTKTRYGLGLKYLANPCTSFKAKIDNTRTITMACEMKATDAATLTLCAACDTANVGKVGCSVEFAN